MQKQFKHTTKYNEKKWSEANRRVQNEKTKKKTMAIGRQTNLSSNEKKNEK